MWSNLEGITLSEISHSQKNKFCISQLTWSTYNSQIHWVKKVEWRLPGTGGRENVELFNGDRVFSFARCKVLEAGCTTMWMCLVTWTHCTLKDGEGGPLFVFSRTSYNGIRWYRSCWDGGVRPTWWRGDSSQLLLHINSPFLFAAR